MGGGFFKYSNLFNKPGLKIDENDANYCLLTANPFWPRGFTGFTLRLRMRKAISDYILETTLH